MEFIQGRKVLDHEPSAEEGIRLARAGFNALLKMIFSHGLVHADLHPGNMLVSGERLVLLDLGLVCTVEPAQRGPMLALMATWLGGDPDAVCAAALSLLDHGDERQDPPISALRGDVAAMMERYGTVRLSTISLGRVLMELLGLLRRHNLRVQPALAMVIVAMGIVEGVGRQLAPGLDLMEEARSYFLG